MRFRLFVISALTIAIILQVAKCEAQTSSYSSFQEISSMFPEAEEAAEQLETLVDGWKSQLEALETQISILRSKIAEKAYLTEDVKIELYSKLGELKRKEQELTAMFFGPDGDYDKAVKKLMLPIEKKINIYIENLKREE